MDSKRLFVLIAAAIAYGVWQHEPEVELGPGVSAPTAPIQKKAHSEPFEFEGYTIKPLQNFSLQAKVLSRTNYFTGKESDLSPMDLALGWGRMSDESILKDIKITQSNRWYYWRVDSFPIPQKELETHSANMHMIPANDEVKAAMKNAHKGNVIALEGYLVSATQGSWSWNSSLSRSDTGNGACELVFVKRFEVLQ